MARAGQEGTPVFLIGGKPEVLAQTEAKLRAQWRVNIVGSQDGYFTRTSGRHCLNVSTPAVRRL